MPVTHSIPNGCKEMGNQERRRQEEGRVEKEEDSGVSARDWPFHRYAKDDGSRFTTGTQQGGLWRSQHLRQKYEWRITDI